eukprot:Skav210221  [mRNA]  locus=scaffold2492:235089:236546:- [translate_table: standard]
MCVQEKTDDDDILENLAQVEGLAGLRLGYAKSTPDTADRIAERGRDETLPFSGGLYISEMALSGSALDTTDLNRREIGRTCKRSLQRDVSDVSGIH